jgi:small-conductance mechanosensitive channel
VVGDAGVVFASAHGPPAGWPSWLDWLYFLGRWIVDNILGTFAAGFSPGDALRVLTFVTVLFLAYAAGKGFVFVLRRTVLKPPRVDSAMARLLSHFSVFLFVTIGFSAGLTLFGTNLTAIATGLGLLSLALGFGMQNTVANLMGGISLAVDKPFRPGDRIKIGDYWGSVQTIGLRSTRIVTPRMETVLVPNKIMEEREIWNYTLNSPEYRLHISIPISYDSDWRLAESILTKAAEGHDNILRFRPIRVLLRAFGESGVDLELRCWIADVTQRAETISDLLKAIKDRFDAAGIEIPFPYRTIVQKKDLPKPATPKGELKSFVRPLTGTRRRILVAVADPHPARERAEYVVSLAKALDAGIVGLFIQPAGPVRIGEGEHSLRALGDVAHAQRIWFKPIIRRGHVLETIREAAKDEDVDLIVVGAGRGRVLQFWRQKPGHVGADLRTGREFPVHEVPAWLRVTPQTVAAIQAEIDAYRKEHPRGTISEPDDWECPPPPDKPPST